MWPLHLLMAALIFSRSLTLWVCVKKECLWSALYCPNLLAVKMYVDSSPPWNFLDLCMCLHAQDVKQTDIKTNKELIVLNRKWCRFLITCNRTSLLLLRRLLIRNRFKAKHWKHTTRNAWHSWQFHRILRRSQLSHPASVWKNGMQDEVFRRSENVWKINTSRHVCTIQYAWIYKWNPSYTSPVRY